MIIEGLLNVLYNVFSALTSAIDIPAMPADVSSYISTFTSYIKTGLQILAVYTPLQYMLTLFGIVIAIELGLKIYHFVMWVIKKIPMLGVS